MLGVDAELAAVAPLHVARRAAGSEPTSVRRNVVLPWPLSPTIAAREPWTISRSMPDGDGAIGIADRRGRGSGTRRPLAAATRRGSGSPRSAPSAATSSTSSLFELLALRLRPRGRRGAGLVAGDEVLELPPLGEHGGVGPLDMGRLLPLVVEEGVDLARDTPSACRAARSSVWSQVAAEEGPVVRDDQAGLAVVAQEVLEQDLGAQVEEVRRLVEQEQVRLVEEQGGELDAGLPAARELPRPGRSSVVPLSSNWPATSPHFQSGWPLSRIRKSRAVSPGRKGSCCRR